MRFEPFELERWLPAISAEINLAGALAVPLQYRDIIDGFDLGQTVSYNSTRGSLKLREKVSGLYASGKIHAENVLITTGTAEANFLLLSTLLNPGDEFILVTPSYLQSMGLARAMGALVKTVGLHEEAGWRLDLDELEAAFSPKTKAVLVTNPNNPTGSRVDEGVMGAICRIADRFGAFVIADEALRGLEVSGVAAPSPAELYERGLSTGSMSKIGLSGIRIGWIVGPREVVDQCWTRKDYTTLAHSGLGETLAESALEPRTYERIRTRARNFVREQSSILMEWVERNSRVLTCVRPLAGGSAFPAYNVDVDSVSLCRRAEQEVSVALAPGDCFGASRHFRIRHGAPLGTLQEGLSRLDRFFASL